MIYFDSAATSMLKPPSVAEAVSHAISAFGGGGRSAYPAALEADRAIYRAREQAARLLGAPAPKRVAFTSNATESLNIVVEGLLSPGDHAITTAASHNSVLRPLYRARKRGVSLSVLPVAPDGSIDYDAFEALFMSSTRLVIATHASNLTGDVYDVARMARICHGHGALLAVDAAQTAGAYPVDMQAIGADIIAFTGHKALLGPQGTGGICVATGIDIPPFKVGGSGFKSFDEEHPSAMPECFEAGTMNAHGIAGLSAGIAFIEETGIDRIAQHEASLARRFEDGAKSIEGVTVYGGHADVGRCGIVATNVGDLDSAVVADILSRRFDICVRAGIHCAPLMHEALGTQDRGCVRFSFSYFNTEEEVDEGVEALKTIAEEA